MPNFIERQDIGLGEFTDLLRTALNYDKQEHKALINGLIPDIVEGIKKKIKREEGSVLSVASTGEQIEKGIIPKRMETARQNEPPLEVLPSQLESIFNTVFRTSIKIPNENTVCIDLKNGQELVIFDASFSKLNFLLRWIKQ